MTLKPLPQLFAIASLPPGAAPKPCGAFWSVTHTEAGTSLVCEDHTVPDAIRVERGWRALEVEGPLPFTAIGVLAGIAAPLAAANISIFAVSTFETDFILIKDESLADAMRALREAGHTIAG